MSYLSIPSLVEAIKTSGAQAVHPGYGFLSENYKFIEALEGLGVAFIGPKGEAMRRLGDKIESKRIARAAGTDSSPYENVSSMHLNRCQRCTRI